MIPALLSAAHALALTGGATPFRANGKPPVILFTTMSTSQYPPRALSRRPRGQNGTEIPVRASIRIYIMSKFVILANLSYTGLGPEVA